MERTYDPELAPLIPFMPAPASFDDIDAARLGLAEMIETATAGIDPPPGVTWRDLEVARPDGGRVPVRCYRPPGQAGDGPAVLYLHGGGFCLGSLESEHLGAAQMTAALGAVVVSVDYRLAPEHPYPAALEDCYASLTWLVAEASSLGVDPARVAVAGQSAGGGLAAALTLLARDRGGPQLCFQFLGIPELDDRLETPSMRASTDTPVWTRGLAEQSWRAYLGERWGGDVPPHAAPARASDLSGLPPAYISTMEHDPLRDEGILYALALLGAGVPVELHQFPGTFHGSGMVTSAAVSRRGAREATDALRRALGVAEAGEGSR